MKQILMVGAGSVGGFFGAHLAKHNPNVSFLLRPKTFAAVTAEAYDSQRHRHLHGPSAGRVRSKELPAAGSDHPLRQSL